MRPASTEWPNRRRQVARGLLPYFGTMFFLVPLLWSASDTSVRASSALIYLFAVWFGLILCCAWFARRGSDTDRQAGDEITNTQGGAEKVPETTL